MGRLGAATAVLVGLMVACGGGTEQASGPTRAPAPTGAATAAPPDGDPSLDPAPDFTLATFDGDTFTLSDHFGELPVVLNFWAPW